MITRKLAALFALSALAVVIAAPKAAIARPDITTHSRPAQSLPAQDLRSPDTRDAASGYDPEPAPVAAPEPSGSGRFDWVSAAIAAAAVGGLVLLLIGFLNGGEWSGKGRIGRRRGLRA
jgi:hypothetical protein